MIDLLLLGIILAGAYGIGAELLERSGLARVPWLKKGVFATALGLGILAYLVLLLGLLGLLRPWIGWLLVGIEGGIAAWHLVRSRRQRRESEEAAGPPASAFPPALPEHPDIRPLRWILGLLVGIGLGAGLLTHWAPTTAWDDLTYHLAAPKTYLRDGGIHYIPTDHHSNFPFTLEMLYTLGLLLRDQTLARLFHFAALVLTVLGLYCLGRDHFGKWVGPLAAATLVFTPTVQGEMGTAYTEFGLALYQLLAVYALLEHLRGAAQTMTDRQDRPTAAPRADSWLDLLGLNLGFALGIKATALVSLAALLGILAFLGWQDRQPGKEVGRGLLRVALIALFVGSPWYLKSYLWTGNPVFPFLHRIFPSPYWSADREAAYKAAQQDFGRPERIARTGNPAHRQWNAHRRLSRFPTVLWRLTMEAPDFYDRAQSFAAGQIGPLYLGFLPVAVGFWLAALRQRPRAVGVLLVYSLLSLLFWFQTMQYTRYLVPLLPVWALLAAYGMEGALRLTAYARGILWTLLLGTFGFGVFFGALLAGPSLPVALGQLSPEQYLLAHYPAYRAMRFLNTQTPESAKVILLGEPLGFYCDRPYFYGEAGHSTLIPYQDLHSAADLLHFYRDQLGATHLLINQRFIPWRTGRDPFLAALREGVERGWLRPVYAEEHGPYVVWEIVLPPPPATPVAPPSVQANKPRK
jgi:4-amino-4-deoxy-L-arabinose transferase-like glycosyltransferase